MSPYVIAFLFVFAVLAAACRGEPVPRDYQNAPPAMTNPADEPEETPFDATETVNPQPDYGVEGTAAPYEDAKPPESDLEPGDNPDMEHPELEENGR